MCAAAMTSSRKMYAQLLEALVEDEAGRSRPCRAGSRIGRSATALREMET